MVTNLLFKEKYEVGVEKEKCIINNEKTSIKDIPIIRYRFKTYGELEKQFIGEQMKKFEYSVHLAELQLSGNTQQELQYLVDEFNNLAIFVYIPIDDTDVKNGLTDNKLEILESIKDEVFDRLLLLDNSTTLHIVSANKIKEQVEAVTGVSKLDIGICNSPLSIGENACLTAIRARDIIATYGTNECCAIPSANHQCMGECGCIRFIEITSDIPAPKVGNTIKEKSISNSNKKADNEVKEKKKSTQKKVKGIRLWV